MAGIKTNISLFQRILRDADFQAGKLDTGYLDRLLANKDNGGPLQAPESMVAAIAAGLFAVLDPASAANRNGNATGMDTLRSNWKHRGRSEALR